MGTDIGFLAAGSAGFSTGHKNGGRGTLLADINAHGFQHTADGQISPVVLDHCGGIDFHPLPIDLDIALIHLIQPL